MTASRPASPPSPGLAVVVVNHGDPALLETHVAPSVPPGARVVVVDNLTTPAHRAAVDELAGRHGWTAVLSERNGGFGDGVNRGVARARELGCDRFLLLNPDCGLAPAAVAALDAHVREHPTTLVAPVIVAPGRDRPWFVGYALDPRNGTSHRDPDPDAAGAWGWLTGACLAVHAELWERVGGFDDRYFLYWEDIDLSRRVVDAGGSLAVRADLQARHEVGATQAGSGKSPLYCYQNTRNRLRYAALHLSRRERRRWLLTAPAYAWEVTLRSGRRYVLTHPSLLWASIRGTVSGATLLLRAGYQDRAKR